MNGSAPAAYPGGQLLLSSLTPRGLRRAAGLRAAFCDLRQLRDHLRREAFDGYLSLLDDDGQPDALVVFFEGRAVNAAAALGQGTAWGRAALGELARRYANGQSLDVYDLDRAIAHPLAGISERPWRSTPPENFTGARLTADGVELWHAGEPVAFVNAKHLEPGLYPAPLRPPELEWPRAVGPWASSVYSPTLRGRDALNPITDANQRLRAASPEGPAVLRLLLEMGTPARVAERLGRDVLDLEGLVSAFVRDGLVRSNAEG
ncbi:MAG TPA: hypothetical protein VHN99_11725 [Deinococcales bacterium]|nr:hypothetical protein [Deinococcales bacterium]